MTDVSILRREIRRINRIKSGCVDRYGVVKPYRRYEYQELMRLTDSINRTIEWLGSRV